MQPVSPAILRKREDKSRPKPMLSSQRTTNISSETPITAWKSPNMTKKPKTDNFIVKRRSVPKEFRAFFTEAYYAGDRPAIEAIENWRLENRIRTAAIGMILALNLRVSPPGAPPSPRARSEAWIIPSRKKVDKGIDHVSLALKEQFLSLCPKASRNSRSFMLKQSKDPPVDNVKSMCLQLRSFAKEKRVILHYNGHGVPKPSTNGEIWVFNRELTQYIPLSLYDLQTWIGGPTFYIFDCSRGGLILEWLAKFTEQRKDEQNRTNLAKGNNRSSTTVPSGENLFFEYYAISACAANESLPANEEHPADLLTCCLTTPIKVSLRWASVRTILRDRFVADEIDYLSLIDQIPGSLDDRQTPLGELNWIFTAITETIAWECVSPELFQKLFREDPVVAGFFRNYLLADRILRSAQCTPSTYPKLPETHYHPMWKTWDQVLDSFLEQLPRIVRQPKSFKSSSFFQDHLTSFEVWLAFPDTHRNKMPRELPIVLQALLSPIHRIRALEVFKEFIDLGVGAVNLSLAVGVFHYVLRLLQRASGPSASILIFIWTKIIAADHSLQEDLLKVDAHLFFIKVLRSTEFSVSDRVRAAFILSILMDEYPQGQVALLKADLIPICASLLNHSHGKLRHWAVICIGKICENNVAIKQNLVKNFKIQDLFLQKIHDQLPDNRAAVIYAIGNFISTGTPIDDCEIDLALSLKAMVADINPIVRRELITTLSHLTVVYESEFKKVALASAKQEVLNLQDAERSELREIVSSDIGRLWRVLYSAQFDPIPSLSSAANQVVLRIHCLAMELVGKSQKNNIENIEAVHNFLMNAASVQKSTPQISATQLPAESRSSNSFRKVLRIPGQPKLTPSANTTPLRSSIRVSQDESTSSSSPFTLFQVRSLRRSNYSTATASPEHQPLSADHRASCVMKRGGSKLYQWACEGFNFPSLHPPQVEHSPIQCWKRMKHVKLLEAMESLKSDVASQKLEQQVAALVNENYHVSGLLVHPLFPVIVSTSTDDVIRVWDWKQKVLLCKFSNTNPPGTHVSSMSVVNELEESDLLMTGSSDGVIRVWKSYYNQSGVELCTAWRAHKQPDNSSNLCHLWNQTDGTVLTAGEYPVMRMWDVDHGIAVQDIPTGTQSTITSMTQESPAGPIVVVGDASGVVRIFDCRINSRSSLVRSYEEHKRKIINVQMMYNSVKIVSGSVGGDVRFYDLRTKTPESIFSVQAHSRSEMASLAAHTHAPIIATGTQNQTIKVTNHSGQRLNDIKYYSKYLGQRIGAVSCLQFHPHEPLLVAGDSDGVVAVYKSSAVS